MQKDYTPSLVVYRRSFVVVVFCQNVFFFACIQFATTNLQFISQRQSKSHFLLQRLHGSWTPKTYILIYILVRQRYPSCSGLVLSKFVLTGAVAPSHVSRFFEVSLQCIVHFSFGISPHFVRWMRCSPNCWETRRLAYYGNTPTYFILKKPGFNTDSYGPGRALGSSVTVS